MQLNYLQLQNIFLAVENQAQEISVLPERTQMSSENVLQYNVYKAVHTGPSVEW